jgi:hypothetical protein
MKTSYAIGVSALFLLGVASQTSAADDPPHMIKCGEHGTCWNSGKNFRPVPPQLQAKGDRVCRTDKKYTKHTWPRAIGWHPDAKDLHGNKIPGGGFNCGDDRQTR